MQTIRCDYRISSFPGSGQHMQPACRSGKGRTTAGQSCFRDALEVRLRCCGRAGGRLGRRQAARCRLWPLRCNVHGKRHHHGGPGGWDMRCASVVVVDMRWLHLQCNGGDSRFGLRAHVRRRTVHGREGCREACDVQIELRRRDDRRYRTRHDGSRSLHVDVHVGCELFLSALSQALQVPCRAARHAPLRRPFRPSGRWADCRRPASDTRRAKA